MNTSLAGIKGSLSLANGISRGRGEDAVWGLYGNPGYMARLWMACRTTGNVACLLGGLICRLLKIKTISHQQTIERNADQSYRRIPERSAQMYR